MKLSGRLTSVLLLVVVVLVLVATDQILPATSERQAQMRIWLAARATGIVALALLTATVVLGILLSHPDQARWKKSKHIFPWHEALWVFVLGFIAVHMTSLAVDEYAGVGIGGALVPGLSTYRSVPVALGVVALYAMLITSLTARYTRLLPPGVWLKVHRFGLAVLGLAWSHGVLAGTDTVALAPLYWGICFAVVGAATYRYWIVRLRVRRQLPNRSLEDGHVEPHPAP
jgi:DMSO/TMAO reductase YedYZ heme-binding membrane subunit